MSFLLEILPLVGLGIGYLLGKSINPDEAIYFLAYGAIVGTLIQFAVYKIRKEKMQKMTLVTGIILIAFSLLTIIFKNPMFVYMKPTAVSWLFAIGFFVYPKLKGNTVLELMMGSQFELEKPKWMKLNWAWILFNIFLGAVNLVVVFQIVKNNWDESVWVSFKVWVLPLTTLLFVAGQMAYMFKNGKVIDPNKSSTEEEM